MVSQTALVQPMFHRLSHDPSINRQQAFAINGRTVVPQDDVTVVLDEGLRMRNLPGAGQPGIVIDQQVIAVLVLEQALDNLPLILFIQPTEVDLPIMGQCLKSRRDLLRGDGELQSICRVAYTGLPFGKECVASDPIHGAFQVGIQVVQVYAPRFKIFTDFR